MKLLELFPEVKRVESLPKERKSRHKSNRYTPKENRRRYRLHRKVKDLGVAELQVRVRVLVLPVGFPVENYPSIKELIYRFKYYAPTILE